MRLIASDEVVKKWVVIFNGKPLLNFVEADDVEGWVEILDLKSVAELNDETSPILEGDEPEELEYIPTIRKYGEVDFLELKRKSVDV